MLKTCDAFITKFDESLVDPAKATGHLLSGLTAGVKDNYDIRGCITGAGTPEYAAGQEPAKGTSPVVETLLQNGAVITGKTQMDELAYSLMGVNARYGTPPNPAAPSRVPGGSSSGSASATAGNQVDIGLGSDTGGSVRLPASFCGLYGWRTTHDLLSDRGLVPLAPSYDTPGFFTRDAETMVKLSKAFAPGGERSDQPEFWLPEDVWALAGPGTSDALRTAWPEPAGQTGPLLPGGDLTDWLVAFRIHQGYEIWQALGPWIKAHQPDFGPGIKERFQMASRITEDEFKTAAEARQAIRAHIAETLAVDTIWVYPTSPGAAPLRDTAQSNLEEFRNAALTLLCIAGHAGLPQVTVPLAAVDNAPIGLSLVGAPGTDSRLIAAAADIMTRHNARAG